MSLTARKDPSPSSTLMLRRKRNDLFRRGDALFVPAEQCAVPQIAKEFRDDQVAAWAFRGEPNNSEEAGIR